MFCFAALANATISTMYTDITGAFPVWSFKNMQCIFVAYIYNLNAVIVQPMPSRTDSLFTAIFSKVFAILCAQHNYQPALNMMDNKCSKAVEMHIGANKMNIQLVPLHNHRVNAAERAIARFKEHFVMALATVDMFCPPYSFGTNFYHKLILHSTFYSSPIATRVFQPTRNFRVHSILTKFPLPLLGPKHWFTTILQQEPPGRRMQLAVSTLAWPTTTTVVIASTSL
jgi:hypothetical protein